MFRTVALLILFSSIHFVQAQLVETKVATYPHENAVVDVYQIILDTDKADAKSYWNDFMEDENDKKIKGYGLFAKKDLLETEMVVIGSITNKPIKLFMAFAEVGDKTHLRLFAKRENGKYIRTRGGSDRLAFTNMKRLGNRYLEYFLPIYYRENLRNAEENKADALKDVNKLAENIADMKQEVADLKQEIKELETDIVQAESEKVAAENQLAKTEKLLKRRKYTYREIREFLRSLSPK